MAVPQHVGADLGERALEEHQRAVVRAPPGALADQLHRAVKHIQAVVQARQLGAELESRDGVRNQSGLPRPRRSRGTRGPVWSAPGPPLPAGSAPASVCRLSTSRVTRSMSPCPESLYRPGPDSPPLHSGGKMASADRGDAQRLLIVEDEQALAQAMARTLRARGYLADIALSGAEARERFGAVDYALVLMDIRLPDESGYGLLGELNKKRPQPAVVMISGVDDPELGRAAVDHGAYGYYVKPVGATELYLATVN